MKLSVEALAVAPNQLVTGQAAGPPSTKGSGDNAFFQLLQALMAAQNKQTLPAVTAQANGGADWLAALLSTLRVTGSTPVPAEEALPPNPTELAMPLTDLLAALQPMVNQSLAGLQAGDTPQAAPHAAAGERDQSDVGAAGSLLELAALSAVLAALPVAQASGDSTAAGIQSQPHPAAPVTSASPVAVSPVQPANVPARGAPVIGTVGTVEARAQPPPEGFQAVVDAASNTLAAAPSYQSSMTGTAGGRAPQATDAMPAPQATDAMPAPRAMDAMPAPHPVDAAPAPVTAGAAVTGLAARADAEPRVPVTRPANSGGAAAVVAEGARPELPVQPLASAAVPSAPVPGAAAEPVSRPLPGLPDVPVLHQVVRAVEVLQQGGAHEVRLQLQPPALGQLLVQLRVSGGDVSVHMLAETAQAQNVIREHLPELRAAMAAQGLQADNLAVTIGNHLSAFDMAYRQPERWEQYPQYPAVAPLDEAKGVVARAGARTPADGLHAVDYQV